METAFKYFEAVIELGSIRKAAERLHISASSISRQIQKLEHHYGVPLLVRQAQGVRLTPAGELAARYVQSRGKEMQRLRSGIEALKNLESGHVVIYTVEGMLGGLLPRALGSFGRTYPLITYKVVIGGTDDVMRALAEDRCDIGIPFQPHPRPDVETIVTIHQPLMAAMSPDHELAERSRITLRDVGDHAVGVPDRSFGIRHLIDHAIMAEKLRLNIRMETNSIEMMRQFAMENMGIVFLPAFSFERELATGELVSVPIVGQSLTMSTTQVCKRADVELTWAASRLVDVIANTAGAFSSVA